MITFINPVLDETTRTVKVRVNINNKDKKLKPGMFVNSIVRSTLDDNGDVINVDLAGKWISPMHPEIVKNHPGKCDICGMDLVPAEELGFKEKKDLQPPLVIPRSAPLITGKRAIVYVETMKDGKPAYVGKEIILGSSSDKYFIVKEGLEEGEMVVVNGNFKIDSALQISAKPSMMNPEGNISSSEHHH